MSTVGGEVENDDDPYDDFIIDMQDAIEIALEEEFVLAAESAPRQLRRNGSRRPPGPASTHGQNCPLLTATRSQRWRT